MITAEIYSDVFFNALLVIVLLASFVFVIEKRGFGVLNGFYSFLVTLVVLLYIGLRPISGHFVDMITYAHDFRYYASGGGIRENSNDILWGLYMIFCSGVMTIELFFLTTAGLYVLPLYFASRNFSKRHSFMIMLMLIGSFSFWAYGTNGMRNGIATSVFLLGLSLYDKNKILSLGLIALTYLIHGSMIIPIAGLFLSVINNNPKHFFLGWCGAIALSLVLGNYFGNMFTALGIGGDRLGYLTNSDHDQYFSKTGFRWDFLGYSSVAVIVGVYLVVIKGFKDVFYNRILNIYIAANAFWILVIRASYSNRFAYVSWFMMAIVIFYPFLKKRFFSNQREWLSLFMLLYFGFTYCMYLIYKQ